MHLREVQVFDSSNANKAQDMIATQSSNYTGAPIGTQSIFSAAYGVNGNFDDLFHTNKEAGTFNFLSSATSVMVYFKLITLTLFLFFLLRRLVGGGLGRGWCRSV